MAKSTAAVISALALCIGLLAGVILMSSQVEKYKEQKRQAEIALEKIRRETQFVIDKQNSVKRAFSKEEAGDPHRRFGFEVLYCRKRIREEAYGDVGLYIVSEIRNVSSKPLQAELQKIVRDQKGLLVIEDICYVPSSTNLVPGETYAFTSIVSASEIRGYRPDDLTVDIIILNSSMRY